MKKIYLLTQKKLDAIIARHISEYAAKTNQKYEHELLMKQADLAALQGQINPHFLYNVLECIRGQAIMEGVEDIAAASKALSQYFRYCINNSSSLVTLNDELEYVKNYITIQQYRFPNRFQLEISVENEELLDTVTPKLILQPIVENAILHGLSNKLQGGIIQIDVHATLRHIQITISDNGTGIASDQLLEINQSLMVRPPQAAEQEKRAAEDIHDRSNGIALNNVNKRIKMLFGDEYGITVFSGGLGNGTSVTVFMPYNNHFSKKE